MVVLPFQQFPFNCTGYPEVEIGGALRFNYNLSSWKPEQKNGEIITRGNSCSHSYESRKKYEDEEAEFPEEICLLAKQFLYDDPVGIRGLSAFVPGLKTYLGRECEFFSDLKKVIGSQGKLLHWQIQATEYFRFTNLVPAHFFGHCHFCRGILYLGWQK